MTSKEFPPYVRVIVIAVIIVISFFLFQKKKEKTADLLTRGRYTIGETKGWSHNHRSSDYNVDYIYSVKGIFYKKFMAINSLSGIQTKNAKYIVKYDSLNPANSKMLFNMKVRSHLGNFIDTGWVDIPEFVILY